jgi:hypothetical protein
MAEGCACHECYLSGEDSMMGKFETVMMHLGRLILGFIVLMALPAVASFGEAVKWAVLVAICWLLGKAIIPTKEKEEEYVEG